MKWFKHDSDAHGDARLKRLRMRYGLEGYGLYWYCLELIARDVSETRLTFELEHDSDVLAYDLNLHRDRIEEMMRFMVEIGLFESSSGRITCLKMLSRIDQSQTSNPAFRAAISAARGTAIQALAAPNHDGVMTASGQSHDAVMMKSCKTRLDKTSNTLTSRFAEFWLAYPRKVGKAPAEKAWAKAARTPELADLIIANVRSRAWSPDPQFIPHAATFLNQRRWEDESSATAPHAAASKEWGA